MLRKQSTGDLLIDERASAAVSSVGEHLLDGGDLFPPLLRWRRKRAVRCGGSDSIRNIRRLFKGDQHGPESSFNRLVMLLDKGKRRVNMSYTAIEFQNPALALLPDGAAAFRTGYSGEGFFDRFLLHGFAPFRHLAGGRRKS